jgi:hypothetical protein
VAALAGSVAAGGDPRLAAALPPPAAASVLDRALRPDRFYREVFARRMTENPLAAALYLPGIDIAADGWRGGDVSLADLVRSQLQETDPMLARSLAGTGTVALVLDPGRRRERGEGRVILWRRAGCAGAGPAGRVRIVPEAVAAALLRALGLPQSAELPLPPSGCRWAPPPVVVPGYGQPHRGAAAGPEGAEYLENLRSLGYL